MKVGIMSMQRVRNYGSFLQAYGLKKTIESLGHKVEFVDYKVEPPLNIPPQREYVKPPIISRVIRKIREQAPQERHLKALNLQKKEFIDTFEEKNFPMLGIDENKHYRTKLDALVIGSDEVFNCLQESKAVGYSRELFGKDNNAKKLISYAGSFGNTTLARLKQYGIAEEVGDLLNKFDAISVRDSNSGNVVESLTNKKPFFHLDPVLISDYSAEQVKDVDEKDYIIVYGYSGRITPEEGNIIRQFAKKENKKLICIQGTHKFCDEYVLGTPFEILAYFKGADYIITDTFHGSIFSIINQKPFATIVRKTVGESYGNEEKLTDLLTRLGLKDRILTDMSKLEAMLKTPIDYERVNKIRADERKKSIDYLREQLKD